MKKITVILALIGVGLFFFWLFVSVFWLAMNDMPQHLDPFLNEMLACIILYLFVVAFLFPIAWREDIKKYINNL